MADVRLILVMPNRRWVRAWLHDNEPTVNPQSPERSGVLIITHANDVYRLLGRVLPEDVRVIIQSDFDHPLQVDIDMVEQYVESRKRR